MPPIAPHCSPIRMFGQDISAQGIGRTVDSNNNAQLLASPRDAVGAISFTRCSVSLKQNIFTHHRHVKQLLSRMVYCMQTIRASSRKFDPAFIKVEMLRLRNFLKLVSFFSRSLPDFDFAASAPVSYVSKFSEV